MKFRGVILISLFSLATTLAKNYVDTDDDNIEAADSQHATVDTRQPLLIGINNHFVQARSNEAMYYAWISKDITFIRLCLQQGADVHFYQDYMLHDAVAMKSVLLVNLLIEFQADLNSRNGAAVRRSCTESPEIAEMLIKHGANINSDLIYFVINNGHTGLVKVLYEAGAEIYVSFELAFIQAVLRNQNRMVQAFLQSSLSYLEENHIIHEVFLDIIENRQLGMMILLIENSNIDVMMLGGEALIVAASKNAGSIVKELIRRGADAHVDNDRALSIAVERGYINVVRVLLRNGVNYFKNYDAILRCAIEKEDRIMIQLISRYFEPRITIPIDAKNFPLR